MYLHIFNAHFSSLEDQRQLSKISYPLLDILFATLCAIISGAKGWNEIHEYISGHYDWFHRQGFLKNGVPVDDTIARVIARIDPGQFSQCFICWMQSINKLSEGELVAIDGKALRASYNREDRNSTIHMVNAYACANKMVVGQIKTEDKSNEITAIPELIKILDLKGALVSIDAVGCQKSIASAIVRKGADYLLSVKSNQRSLHKAVKDALAERLSILPVRENALVESGHGRHDIRHCHIIRSEALEKKFQEWGNVKTIGAVVSYRHEQGKFASLQTRYYISSAELTEQEFSLAVRSHWGIENSLHWVLDVTLKEDDCQIYRQHAAQNIASIRRISLNMLRAEPTKLSIRMKQKRAWMQTEFLEQVLRAGLFIRE